MDKRSLDAADALASDVVLLRASVPPWWIFDCVVNSQSLG